MSDVKAMQLFDIRLIPSRLTDLALGVKAYGCEDHEPLSPRSGRTPVPMCSVLDKVAHRMMLGLR